MLLERTNFGPLDLASSLGVTAVATYIAAKEETFRTSVAPDRGTVSAVSDLRFIGGAVALLYGQLYTENSQTRRFLSDVSLGLLTSFFSTEVMRAAALKRMVSSSKMGSVNDDDFIVEDVVDDTIYNDDDLDMPSTLSYSFGF